MKSMRIIIKFLVFINLIGQSGTPLWGEILIDHVLPETLWFFDIWGSSCQDVYTVGTEGKVYHYDGYAWAPVLGGALAENKADLYAVSGISAACVYLAGKGGTVLAFDGVSWQKLDTGTDRDLRDILCLARNDVYAVGAGGLILHYNGTQWQSMSSPTTRHLWGIWGLTPAELFAVGDYGVILHYDGAAWSPVNSQTNRDLRGIWGVDAAHIYVVGAQGTCLQCNGYTWTAFDMSALGWLYLNDVFGFSPADIYAVGCHGEILHYDGVCWTYATANHSYTDFNYFGVWGSTSGSVYAVGLGGMINKYDGIHWTEGRIPDNTLYWINCIDGPAYNDLYLAGYLGSIYHYDGNTYTRMSVPSNSNINDLWVSGDKTVFAAGTSGTILYFDGSIWSRMKSNTPLHLNGIWGTNKQNIYAIGNYGTVLHYDGMDWQVVTSGFSETFNKIWGTVASSLYLVGTSGIIVHYDGISWSRMESGVDVTLNDIWGTADDNIYVCGRNGVFLHYDGLRWSVVSIGAHGSLTGIAGTSGSNLYVTEETTGYVNYYNGTTWQAITTPVLPDNTKNYLYTVWTDKDRNAFFGGVQAVGLVGSFFYYHPVYTSESMAALTSGLVGYWKFNEGTGNTTVDDSAGKNTGLLNGCEWVTGRYGYALYFNGNSYVELGTGKLGLEITNAFTVSLWFRYDGDFSGTISGKLIRRGNYVYPFDLQLQNTGRLSVQVRTVNGVNRQDTMNRIQPGNWYHAVITYDHGERVFYLNGEANLCTQQTGELYFSSPNSINHLTVGENFTGIVDEVRIYDRALPVDEVVKLFATTGIATGI